jgi:hypothetical protein
MRCRAGFPAAVRRVVGRGNAGRTCRDHQAAGQR